MGSRSLISTDSAAASLKNREQFDKDVAVPFLGYNEPGAKVSERVTE